MDNTLTQISKQQLDNFKAYRTTGDIAANKIFNVLRTKSKSKSYSISRVKIGGSIGKATSLGTSFQPDFDLLVFIYNDEPPFDDILEDFEEMLKRNFQGTGVYVFEKMTRYSLQFQLRVTDRYSEFRGEYISFDLLPAVDFLSSENAKLSENQRDRIQVERSLRGIYCLEDPESDWNLYGSSLSEMGISFVKNQSEFVHDVIRLAKLWNKKVSYHQYIYGRSMMIELVAIFAASEEEDDAEEENRPESIKRAFENFLNKFISFDSNMWVSWEYQTSRNQSGPYKMYQQQLGSRPLILDFANPYNNLAKNVSHEAKRTFEVHARHTLYKLLNNSRGIESCFL